MVTLGGRRAGTMGLRGLLIPLLVLGVAESQLIVSVGPSPVRAVLGSDVLLPCSFAVGENISLSKFYLGWARGGEQVAEYLREQPTNQPRVKLFLEELSRGNCSLGLRNVRVEDEGRYSSTLIYTPDRSEQHLELQVTAAPRLSIPRRAAGTDTATSFPCHVWGFYPQDVTVTWLRDGRVLTDATRSAPQRNPDGTFNLTLTYTFTPTASDSGSIFSCRVSHAALAQPLQEGFPLAVTAGADGAPSKAITGVCIALLLVMAAVLAIYCWRRRRARKAPYSAMETPPEDPAGSGDKTCGEDTVLMGNDGVSDAGEGSEQEPLLPVQGQEQSETQEQDGVQGTASSNSSGSKASDMGTRASSCITQGGPESEAEGETGALEEEGTGAASSQAQPVAQVEFPAQHSTAVEIEEMALNQHSREEAVPSSELHGAGTTEPSSELHGEGKTEPSSELDGEGTIEPSNELDGEGTTEPSSELDGERKTEPSSELHGAGTTEPSSELDGAGTTEPRASWAWGNRGVGGLPGDRVSQLALQGLGRDAIRAAQYPSPPISQTAGELLPEARYSPPPPTDLGLGERQGQGTQSPAVQPGPGSCCQRLGVDSPGLIRPRALGVGTAVRAWVCAAVNGSLSAPAPPRDPWKVKGNSLGALPAPEEMVTLGGRRAGTMGLGVLLIPLLVLGAADSQLVLSMGSSPVRAALGSDVQLPCTFTVRERFEITKFYLAWSLGGHRVAEYVREQKIYQQGSELFPEELSRGNCSLLLRQVAVRDGGRYTSTVIYTPDKEEKQLELQVTAAPRVSIPRKAGVLNAATSFPCHAWGFYPGDVTVTWLRDGQVLTDASGSAPQRNPDGTFNLTLTYTFTPTTSDSGSIFSCLVSHAALAQPLREEFPLVIGAPPRISVPRRSAGTDTATSFPCHVWGFYPGAVTVTWLRDGQVLTDATRSAPQRNPDGTFNLTLTYTFTPTASDSGSIFSCRVSHAALAQPLREGFPLEVTGAHGSTTVLTAVLGISVTLAAVTTALATYFWCRWKGRCAPTSTDGKVPYSVSEVLGPVWCLLGQEVTLSYAMVGKFPKDTAVTWERIHGQDRTDGVSEAGEGPEHQPLLQPQPQHWRATEQRSGTCLTASLSFTPTVQDDGTRVRCSFHHQARGIREQRESGEIRPWRECPQGCDVSLGPLP
ncbi:butyrophilin subfamily 2 member A1-like [Platysternon megacephalum]|uniref:Butyrophilin subfamily 2 member A1-like n=1 Tax=Platysternon megacephalum TaxID=55544 RepID=A0A4D9DKB0_9SAUR|nr:butyrophilin subfamily 2 member A1-like [Platysternon megacephalum]